jgi:hypothetical protein
VNPFRRSRSLAYAHIDMGVDYSGRGPIAAIGDALIIGDGGSSSGWPGNHYLLYRLRNGQHAGRYIYVAEYIRPRVRGGRRVKAGGAIADFAGGIETGWGSSTLNNSWFRQTCGRYHDSWGWTEAGRAFARLLRSLGAPTESGVRHRFPHCGAAKRAKLVLQVCPA